MGIARLKLMGSGRRSISREGHDSSSSAQLRDWITDQNEGVRGTQFDRPDVLPDADHLLTGLLKRGTDERASVAGHEGPVLAYRSFSRNPSRCARSTFPSCSLPMSAPSW
jgi:hypothetical protein